MTADTLITDPTLLSVLSAAQQARKQCLELIDLLAAHHASERSEASSDEVLDSERKLTARLAMLRGLNRKAILGVRNTKQETTEARQEIDSLHLVLQNLYYEQRHLRGEIGACEGSEHKYTSLALIPASDFLAQHPEHASSNEHELTLARIADEHAARQELERQRLELVKRKEALVKETTAKKEELNKLDAEVEKWIAGQDAPRKVFEAREKMMVDAEARRTKEQVGS